eukprot:m.74126 g.74126  ORF g.74126 m.74126 type:complete len:292 (-) comp14408_c0_seq3:109-984(-)
MTLLLALGALAVAVGCWVLWVLQWPGFPRVPAPPLGSHRNAAGGLVPKSSSVQDVAVEEISHGPAGSFWKEELVASLDCLCDALWQDPVWVAMLACNPHSPDGYWSQFYRIRQTWIRLHFASGGRGFVARHLTSGAVVGTVWLARAEHLPNTWKWIKAYHVRMFTTFGRRLPLSLQWSVAVDEARAKVLASCGIDPKRFLYIASVTVAPAWQHMGLGKRLVAHACRQADEQGLPTVLETARESSVKFYGGFGFRTETVVKLRSPRHAWQPESVTENTCSHFIMVRPATIHD